MTRLTWKQKQRVRNLLKREFGSSRAGINFTDRVRSVQHDLVEEEKLFVTVDGLEDHVRSMVKGGLLHEENLGKGLRPGSDVINAYLMGEFREPREGSMSARARRVKEELKKRKITMTESGLLGRVKEMVEDGRLEERNLSKQTPPSDQELEKRAKLVEAQARDPENDYNLSRIAEATDMDINAVRKLIMERIAPGWEASSYMEALMLERLWSTRQKHNMDPELMGEHLSRSTDLLKRFRGHLTTAEELAGLASEHGIPTGVGGVLKQWHTYKPIVKSARSLDGEGRKKLLRRHRII